MSSNSTNVTANVTKNGPHIGYENDKAISSNIKDAFNYTATVGVKAVREVKWANLLIGIASAIILLLAIGVGLYFLLKYHRKKIL